MAIYTRRGDEGETDVGTVRIRKDCDYTEAIGELDELSALLAYIASRWPETADFLDPILQDIYRVNAYLATGGRKPHDLQAKELEKRIKKLINLLVSEERDILALEEASLRDFLEDEPDVYSYEDIKR